MNTSSLRSRLLSLAIHGKLVPQDPNDEPASVLLQRIREEKERLILERIIKKGKKSAKTSDTAHYENAPFELPEGWCFVKGEDLFNPMASTSPQGETFKYIDINSINNKKQKIDEVKVIQTINAPSRASRFTQKGDVVFSMVRPYLRNIAKVEEDNCIASTGFYVCRPTEAITSDYCYYLMISNYVVDGLNQFMKGDNSPSINKIHIDNWKFPLPPLAEQRRIVFKIEEIFRELERIEGSL